MTQIKPFKSVYYDSEKVGDLSKVVCPPYDVISDQQRNAYYSESDHNFIRILLGKEEKSDDKHNNKYSRAKKIFESWLKDGVMRQDEKPCIYYYKQEYRIMGQKHSRLGFISLMKLQGAHESRIYPHEKTHAQAKEDRLKLWRTLSANLSPIFVCFSDREKKVEKIFTKDVSKETPFIDIVDDDGVRHIIWRLSDPKLIQEIVDSLAEQQLFIADGHHRYEVAQEFQRWKLSKQGGSSNGQDSINWVMTYFTNMDSRDLMIFPVHRIIKHLSRNPLDHEFLSEYFRIDKMKSKDDLMIPLAKAGKNEHAFGIYTRSGIVLLRLKNKSLIDKSNISGSEDYRQLDATILKYFVLDRLGVKSEDIIYTKDVKEATDAVDEGQADACFIMNPVKIQHLKNIALNGERMPPKTTYFYPKVLSGLTVYKME